MKESLRTAFVLAALTLTGGIGFLRATDEIASSEELECAACHDPPDSELLTDRGKYYELMRTLEGFDLVIHKFGDCSYCHAREPGSKELTQNGVRFQWMMQDMRGLRAWLEEYHPRSPDKDLSEGSDKDHEGGNESDQAPSDGP